MWSEKTLVINLGNTKTLKWQQPAASRSASTVGVKSPNSPGTAAAQCSLGQWADWRNWPVDYQGNSGNWDRRTEEEVKTDQFTVALYSFTKAVLGVPRRKWQSHGPSQHTPGGFSSVFNIWKLAIIECCCVLSCSAENRTGPTIAHRLFLNCNL